MVLVTASLANTGQFAAPPSCTLKRSVRSWPSFRPAPHRTEARPQSRSSSRVRAPGRLHDHWLSCEHRRAFTVILFGFNNGPPRMVAFAHAWRVAALSRCDELPGVPCRGGRDWDTGTPRKTAHLPKRSGLPMSPADHWIVRLIRGPPCRGGLPGLQPGTTVRVCDVGAG